MLETGKCTHHACIIYQHVSCERVFTAFFHQLINFFYDNLSLTVSLFLKILLQQNGLHIVQFCLYSHSYLKKLNNHKTVVLFDNTNIRALNPILPALPINIFKNVLTRCLPHSTVWEALHESVSQMGVCTCHT